MSRPVAACGTGWVLGWFVWGLGTDGLCGWLERPFCCVCVQVVVVIFHMMMMIVIFGSDLFGGSAPAGKNFF